jgi:hypothetical protein
LAIYERGYASGECRHYPVHSIRAIDNYNYDGAVRTVTLPRAPDLTFSSGDIVEILAP